MTEIVKASKTDYSGTCPKCKKFIRGFPNNECPMKLPAKSPNIPSVSSCPMKIEKTDELLRGAGAVTTTSSPNLFNVTYGGKKHGKDKETEKDSY